MLMTNPYARRKSVRGIFVAFLLCFVPHVVLAEEWGLRIGDNPGGQGAMITAVDPGGVAGNAGLRAGDLITHAEGRPLSGAGDLAGLLSVLPPGQAVNLTVTRQGWEKDVTLRPDFQQPAPSGPLKATVAVGDFQVKAARANQQIGDGLREMLLTALHGTGQFIVVERIDIKGIAAEQALSRSAMARPDMAIPGARMDVADVMVYGAVTEFEGEASGSGTQAGMPGVPFSFGLSGKTSHMAIDFRVVDVRTGRLLLAQRVVGSADSSKGSFGASPTVASQALPFSFGSFRNTPMEKAIRDVVVKATQYLGTNLPAGYFRHQ